MSKLTVKEWGIWEKCQNWQKHEKVSISINWSINGSINGSIMVFFDILVSKTLSKRRGSDISVILVKKQSFSSKTVGFRHFRQNPYPNPEAFRHFGQKPPPTPQPDTTGRTDCQKCSNPYPIPGAFCKINENDTFWHRKWHFLRYQICRWHFEEFRDFRWFWLKITENHEILKVLGKTWRSQNSEKHRKTSGVQKNHKNSENHGKWQKRAFCKNRVGLGRDFGKNSHFWQVHFGQSKTGSFRQVGI